MGEKRLPRFPRKRENKRLVFFFQRGFYAKHLFFFLTLEKPKNVGKSEKCCFPRALNTAKEQKIFETCLRKYDRNKFYGSPEFADRKRSQPLFSIFFPGRHVTIFSCGERRRREGGEREMIAISCEEERERAEGEESIKKCWSLSSSFLFVPRRRVSSFAFGANPGLPSLPSFRRAGGTGFNKT